MDDTTPFMYKSKEISGSFDGDERKRDFKACIPSPLYLILCEKYCSHPISYAPRVGEALSMVAWFIGDDALLAGEKSS